MKAKLSGYITSNDSGKFYEDVFEEECIYPEKVSKLVDQANELNEDLEISFTSYGGSVYDANSISAELKQLKNKSIGYLHGLVASAATIIACSFNTVKAYQGSEYLIHNPRFNVMFATLTPQVLEELTRQLKVTTDNSVETYHDKTGISEDTIRDYMNNETSFSATEALNLKFVDEVIPIVDGASMSVDSNYKEQYMAACSHYEELCEAYALHNKKNNEVTERMEKDKEIPAEDVKNPVAEEKKEPTEDMLSAFMSKMTESMDKLSASVTDLNEKYASIEKVEVEKEEEKEEAKEELGDPVEVSSPKPAAVNAQEPKIVGGIDTQKYNYKFNLEVI